MHHRWRVLAPVDLGSDAEARVQHALNVAAAVQGDLTLIHVISSGAQSTASEWPANAYGNCEVRRIALTGPLGETIGGYADDLGADLVTVTSESSRSWNRRWRNSAAHEIAAATRVPVCLGRTRDLSPEAAFRSMLCVVALDGTDDELLRFTDEVAQRSDATVVLLYVLPEVTEGLLAYAVARTDERPLGRHAAEQRLSELSASYSRPHLTAIMSGSAYRSITTLASEYQSDVVITGLRRDGVLSSIDSRDLSSRVSCPVIFVPVAGDAPAGHRAVRRRLLAVSR